jgi:hypothetical protein
MNHVSLPAAPSAGAATTTPTAGVAADGPADAFTALLAAALGDAPVSLGSLLADAGALLGEDTDVEAGDEPADVPVAAIADTADLEAAVLAALAVVVAPTADTVEDVPTVDAVAVEIAADVADDGVTVPTDVVGGEPAEGADLPVPAPATPTSGSSRPDTAAAAVPPSGGAAAPGATATATATATTAEVATATAEAPTPRADATAPVDAAEPVAPTPATTAAAATADVAAADAGTEPGSAVARMVARVMDALDLLQNAPPPRRMTVDLPDVDGLRLHVALRGTEVSVTVLAGGTQGDAAGWGRDLTTALAARGFSLGGFDGGAGEGRQRAPHEQPDEVPVPTATGRRPRPSSPDQGLRL